jgi:uncharacterized Zn finger protein
VSFVIMPVVLGIKQHIPRAESHTIEVVYKSGDKMMRLDNLDDRRWKKNAAKETIDKHGFTWTAYKWRSTDFDCPWEYIK